MEILNIALEKYECIVGLEVHIQMNTASKAFASELNQFSTVANENISAVTLGLPGTLPFHNKIHIKKALKLAIALGCEINEYTYFDRKNYFYPDLPKGYQLTQDENPYCFGGQIILSNGRLIRIHHIHMEEDAGKSIHTHSDNETFLDYNRAGTPLLELVTEPDFRTGDEVQEFINHLRRLVRYIDVSDAVMQQGSLRCDVNLSIRPVGTKTFGTRTETKNLNSASYAKKVIELEFIRQVKQVEKGNTIIQQTLDFDFVTEKIHPLRSKEDAQDYRYFPDPDLAPIHISEQLIEETKNEIKLLPDQAYRILVHEYDMTEYNARIIYDNIDIVVLFMNLADSSDLDHKEIANFIVNHYLPYVKTDTDQLKHYPLSSALIIEFLKLISDNKISNSAAHQKLLPRLLNDPQSPEKLAKKLNIIQENNETEIEKMIAKVIESNPAKVKEYHNGKRGLIGFFMGELMKLSKGKINPQLAKSLLEEFLSK